MGLRAEKSINTLTEEPFDQTAKVEQEGMKFFWDTNYGKWPVLCSEFLQKVEYLSSFKDKSKDNKLQPFLRLDRKKPSLEIHNGLYVRKSMKVTPCGHLQVCIDANYNKGYGYLFDPVQIKEWSEKQQLEAKDFPNPKTLLWIDRTALRIHTYSLQK